MHIGTPVYDPLLAGIDDLAIGFCGKFELILCAIGTDKKRYRKLVHKLPAHGHPHTYI
jgi:hypothetical protein